MYIFMSTCPPNTHTAKKLNNYHFHCVLLSVLCFLIANFMKLGCRNVLHIMLMFVYASVWVFVSMCVWAWGHAEPGTEDLVWERLWESHCFSSAYFPAGCVCMSVCVCVCVFKRKGLASGVLIGQSLRKTPSSLSLIHCCHTFPS